MERMDTEKIFSLLELEFTPFSAKQGCCDTWNTCIRTVTSAQYV